MPEFYLELKARRSEFFHDIFHIQIEKGLTNWRTLMHAFSQVVAPYVKFEVQCIMHGLQKVYLFREKDIFPLQDVIETFLV